MVVLQGLNLSIFKSVIMPQTDVSCVFIGSIHVFLVSHTKGYSK